MDWVEGAEGTVLEGTEVLVRSVHAFVCLYESVEVLLIYHHSLRFGLALVAHWQGELLLGLVVG